MKRYWLKYLILSTAFLLTVFVALALYYLYQLQQPMLAAQKEPIVFIVNQHSSAQSFVRDLKKRGLIQSEFVYLQFIRLQRLSQALKAGVYQILPEESPLDFLDRVVAGDVLVETLTIVEGATWYQVAERMQAANYLHYNQSDWFVIANHYPSAEGLLLADTYRYNAGSSSIDLLRRAHENLQRYLQLAWENRASGLPYKKPYELLITASIIEKETALPHEKKLISGVIVNRLRKNMPLQMDPTVIYALGPDFHGALTRRDLRFDSPYNTYRYRGLPPTPIAMVGKDAIDAAAHPALTDYLYFMAKGDGSHQFSVTYNEQKKAVELYRKHHDE